MRKGIFGMSKYNIFHRCSFKHLTEKSFRKRGIAPFSGCTLFVRRYMAPGTVPIRHDRPMQGAAPQKTTPTIHLPVVHISCSGRALCRPRTSLPTSLPTSHPTSL